ncbi:hypothetical protein [Kineococcus sp. NUM-3379]
MRERTASRLVRLHALEQAANVPGRVIVRMDMLVRPVEAVDDHCSSVTGLATELAGRLQSLRRRLPEAFGEPSLAAFYARYRESDRGVAATLVRHPVQCAVAALATARLPLHLAVLSRSREGGMLYQALARPFMPLLPQAFVGAAVLRIPEDAGEYSQGRSKQTLRRKSRAALRRGIHVEKVEGPDERRRLLERANATERAHPDLQYRVTAPDNDDLLENRLWLVARSRTGDPLVLAVTPYDGRWALLRYFRAIGNGDECSDARYHLCIALVEELSQRGVRFLLDPWSPAGLPNGLRHFQRMVGFRLVRVVPVRRRRGTTCSEV